MNQPEMCREAALNSKLLMWQVQASRSDDERATRTLDEIHRLQWEIGCDSRRGRDE